jgi:hypothetical protein
VKRISLNAIAVVAAHRPPGYADELLAAGKVNGGALEIDQVSLHRVARKYRPTLTQLGIDLPRYGVAWTAVGKRLRTQAGYDAVRVICGQCSLYSCDMFRHHCKKCGCGDIKPQLAATVCPAGKWGAETVAKPRPV